MAKFLIKVETQFDVEAGSYDDACDKAFEVMVDDSREWEVISTYYLRPHTVTMTMERTFRVR